MPTCIDDGLNQNQGLEESRAIIKRLRRRDLYRIAGHALFPNKLKEKIEAADIAKLTDSLHEEDILVAYNAINYAMGDCDPVKYTRFFSKDNPNGKTPA